MTDRSEINVLHDEARMLMNKAVNESFWKGFANGVFFCGLFLTIINYAF